MTPSILPRLPKRRNTAGTVPINSSNSVLSRTCFLSTLILLIKVAIPRTRQMFATVLPNASPIPSIESPAAAAVAETIKSGSETVNAIKMNPIESCEIRSIG